MQTRSIVCRLSCLTPRSDRFVLCPPTFEQVLVARHPQRPYTLDYIDRICTDWIELHGDRAFRDD
ncbi:MAG TPA: hypothetical protein EYO20_07870, partial [Gemmatimonadetes bacterium]|nr:hypothetical protein [Gemmatimonadota bacterium]